MTPTAAELAAAMQRWGFLEDPAPPAALRWIDTFLEAYADALGNADDAFEAVAALRAESCTIPALELERLRSRDVLFFLDSVGQYVDHQAELAGLALDRDLPAIAQEFGISEADAMASVRMALTGRGRRSAAGAAVSAARSRPNPDSDRRGEFAAAARPRLGADRLRSRREAVRADPRHPAPGRAGPRIPGLTARVRVFQNGQPLGNPARRPARTDGARSQPPAAGSTWCSRIPDFTQSPRTG